MERNEVFEKLTEIFKDVMDMDEIILDETTSANDIEEWDSLSQIMLLAEIQKVFVIRFKSSDTIRWRNVGEMVDTIISLCSK